MNPILLASPDTITLAADQTERDAVLLECCDLPDKQLKLSESDLDGIVSRFTAPVPIKLEHMDTSFDPLGTVQRVWRDGTRLLGKLLFPPAVAALVQSRGCKGLSCGLDRSPLTLSELSLVLKPRVASAVLLSDDDAAELARLRMDNAALLAKSSAQRVDAEIVQWKLAGKILPATEGAARILLSAGDTNKITLADGGTQTVAGAFKLFLANSPVLVTLAEMAPDGKKQSGLYGSADGTDDDMTDDQKAWLKKTLGVDPAKVAETIKADKKKMGEHHRRGHVEGGMK